jgi:IPT/TIG domain
MWGGGRSVGLPVLALLLCTVGCGGGGGGSGVHPPPPQPDFSIGLSVASLTLPQGGSSSLTIMVGAENGFSGSVQVTLTGLPSGISSNPASPISVTAGQPAPVVFGASATAATGQFAVSAQGTSGGLTHSSNLALTVQAAAGARLSLSTYVRNDGVALLDRAPGEAVRRHMVYDSFGKRYFVANRAMNRVEVYSATANSLQSTIDVPGASGVGLSRDGATLWVATTLEQILAIDTAALQVKTQYAIRGLSPIPNVVFNRPTELLALDTGKLFVRLKQPAATEALLALWDPAADSFMNLTSVAPSLFQNGLGVMAGSGDQSRVLVGANDASGEVAILDAGGGLLGGPRSLGVGNFSYAAGNTDGSRFAVVFTSSGSSQLVVLDAHLNPVGRYTTSDATGVVFARDGQTLYVAEAFGNGRVVTSLSVATLQKLGQVSDLVIQGIPTFIEEMGDSQIVCGLSNRGVSFLDTSQAATLVLPAPVFANVPTARPAEGPNGGGSGVMLSGANFSDGVQVRFGGQNSGSATYSNSSQLQVVPPASVASGPVNLTAYFSNGWIAIAPDAFSYGPRILQVIPNTGAKTGGDTVYILGQGFGDSSGDVTVKIGSQSATVQKVEAFPAFATSLSMDATYPFPLERITLTTPSGSPGKADISINAPSGSTIAAKAFQFLNGQQTFGHPGLYKFVLYDQGRQQVYLSATDHIDVFDLKAQVFRSTIGPPPNGPPPDAALRGLALTPDNSQLVVADFGAQSVYLINPDGGANNGAKVPVGGVTGFLNSGPARVAATSASTVFVGLSGEGGSFGGCNACLGQMNLGAFPPTYQPAPQPEVTSVIGAPLMQADAKGDTVFFGFASAPGGPVASWSASIPDDFVLASANDSSSDLTTSADGTLFAMRSSGSTQIRNLELSLVAGPTSAEIENVANRVGVPGVALHPSGALLYEPFLEGAPPSAPPVVGVRGGIDIRDAYSGRLRLRVYLPEAFAMLSTDTNGLHGSFFTTDEFGERLFALTSSGLTVIQLASVPLGIGSLSPVAGPASGGASLTVRGSGFQTATQATLGGKAAVVTYKDRNTLLLTTPPVSPGPKQLTLSNPDGESISRDAIFFAQ